MWHLLLPHPLLPLASICLLLRLWSLKDLSDCAYYYYGMPLEVGGGTHHHGNCGCCENGGGVDEEWEQTVAEGGVSWLLWSVRCKVTMQSGGGVTEVCGWGILWDVCPLILLCVCVYARGVCERKKRRRRTHTLPQNTEIYLNCMYIATLTTKELPHITWQSETGVSVFGRCDSSCEY